MSILSCNFAKQLSAMMDIRVAISFPKGFFVLDESLEAVLLCGRKDYLVIFASMKPKKNPPVYGDYDVSKLLKLLESPVARARGIESPQNTTFRVLKRLAEDTNPGRRENTLIPDYEARAMMGRDRTPERLKAGMGGFNLDKTALYGLIRYLTGNGE